MLSGPLHRVVPRTTQCILCTATCPLPLILFLVLSCKEIMAAVEKDSSRFKSLSLICCGNMPKHLLSLNLSFPIHLLFSELWKLNRITGVRCPAQRKPFRYGGSSGSPMTWDCRSVPQVTMLIGRAGVESGDLGRAGRPEFSRPRRLIVGAKHRARVGE